MRILLIFSFVLSFSNIVLGQLGLPSPIYSDSTLFTSPELAIPVDLDKDGGIDIVSSSSLHENIVWFEKVDNEYEKPEILHTLSAVGTLDLVVADFDNDTNIDIVVLVRDEIFWLKNMGGASFFNGPISLLSDVGNLEKISLVDLNTDGFLDIVTVKENGEMGWMAHLDGLGNVANYSQIYSGVKRDLFHPTDLDNDGDMDLVLQNSNDSLLWLENIDAFANFEKHPAFGIERDNITLFKTADIDADGNLDIIPVVHYEGPLYWYKNENNFNERDTLLNAISPFDFKDLIFSDLDEDGDEDLVSVVDAGHGAHSKLYVFENTDGLGNYGTKNEFYRAHFNIQNIHIEDIDDDEIMDVIVAGGRPRASTFLAIDKNKAEIALLKGKGNINFENLPAAFSNPVDILADTESSLSYFLSTIDLNEDGQEDILFGQLSSEQNYAKLMWSEYDETKKDFKHPRHLVRPGVYSSPALFDFDNDGDKDLLMMNRFGFSRNAVWFEKIDGEDNYKDGIDLFQTYYTMSSLSGADINSDGLIDVVFCTTRDNGGLGGFDIGFFWCENLGDGNFAAAKFVEDDNYRISISIPRDYDGDGDIDLLVGKGNGDEIFWLENVDGLGNFVAAGNLIETYLGGSSVFYTDLNQDGIEDFLLTSRGQIELWTSNINTPLLYEHQFTHTHTFPNISGTSLFSTELIDFDNDDDLDILMHHANDLFIFNNTDGLGSFSSPAPISDGLGRYESITFGKFKNNANDLVAFDSESENIFILENQYRRAIIEGEVFYDNNENGIKDNGELLLFNQRINIQPEPTATFSNENGKFFFAVRAGEYELNCQPTLGYKLTTSENISVNITDTIGAFASFGLAAEIDIVDSKLNIASAPTRCGFQVPFWLNYQNSGTLISNGQLAVKIDSLTSVSSVNPIPDSIIGNTLYWNFENFQPSYSNMIHMILQMPNADFIGESIELESEIYTENPATGLSHIEKQTYTSIINCAYDPNDKLVEPNIPGHDNYTLIGDTLTYSVRFQNTGTDTAFTVRIEDYLDVDLEWDGLEVIASSHEFTTLLDQRTGRLQFTFDPIFLPDSTTNEPASHGYITYSIPHKAGIPEYTLIRNEANIFFDFNPAIVTNKVQNIMVSEYPLLFDISPPNCAGDSSGLIAVTFDNPFYESYNWGNGQTGLVADQLAAGVHNLSITKIDGTVLDTLIYLKDPNPIEIKTLNFQDASCFNAEDGEIAVLVSGGAPDYSYAWNNGSLGANIQQLLPGNYSLTITDRKLCMAEKDFTILGSEELLLTVSSTAETDNEENGTATITPTSGTPPYSFFWDDFPSLTDSIALNLSAGTYEITIIDGNNCSIDTSVIVEYLSGIDSSIEQEFQFWITPNPSQGQTTINFELPSIKGWNIEVVNSLGQLILNNNNLTSNQNTWDIVLPPGVYFAQLSHHGIIKTSEIIAVF